MKVRIKISHDPDWKPDLRYAVRYWVHLSDGNWFAIFEGHCGQWLQQYAPHMDYPCPEQAIVDALRTVYAKYDKLSEWRKCRAKPQTFTFSENKYSHVRMPAKRTGNEPRPAGLRKRLHPRLAHRRH